MTRILWMARTLPFPLVTGDKIYSARLTQALAAAGADIAFVGHQVDVPVTPMPGITWHAVYGGLNSDLRALASVMPMVAARHATSSYKQAISDFARMTWDAVIIDHYGMGWALEQQCSFQGRPLFVFVTHNHEESVTHLQARDSSAGPFKQAYFWQNYVKARRLERATARRCDLLTTITEADAALFCITAPRKPSVVLTPGYSGYTLASRSITANTARAIVMFGSYRWSAKIANLKLFLQKADPVMSKAGIEIRVVGDISEEVRQELAARYPSVRFTGFVADPTAHLDVRLAVLAEPIGGGFKLKLLDYIFNRLPIAALDVCASGIPPEVQRHMALFPRVDSLLQGIIGMMENLDVLNDQQQQAFAAAHAAFDWSDRGESFSSAIQIHKRYSTTASRKSPDA